MKKYNKISAFLLAMSIGISPVCATALESVDFSAELAGLKSLIDECAAKGISTEYENITYSVIERFEAYINEDIKKQKPDEMTEFNISKINEMYTVAKANLESYLSGEKTAFDVPKPDMLNLHNDGAVLYDGDTPVISVGYGAFDTAINDLSAFENFGASNIQMEIGPDRVMKNKSWTFSKVGNPDASYEYVSDSAEGEKAIKFTFNGEKCDNVYLTMYQSVKVTPGVKYILTGKRKADGAMSDTWISLNNYNNRNYHYSASDWKEFSIKYTVPDGVEELTVRVVVESKTDGYYIDDLCLAAENTTENLLHNAGFEDGDVCIYEFDKNSLYLEKLLKDLQTAKENNIAASVLLSPHYFPDGLFEEIYFDAGAFFDFNICHPDAKGLIEDYLRGILPYLAQYKNCIQNICITNEPAFATYCFYDYFLPEFHEFLKEKHGTVENLNKAYKTNYSDFSEVDMPNGIEGNESIWVAMRERNEAHYDWLLFNEKVLTDWHVWFASIVKEYLPDVPVNVKLLETTLDESEETYYYGRMIQGADLEMFDTFSDYAGNDALTYADDIDSYYTTMFYYDYLKSATGKPVYNAEDHVIRDKTTEYNDMYAAHVRNYLWQGAVHGRNLSTLWVWDRNSGDKPSFEGSILYRPDVVNEVGKTSLDLTRLSSQITQMWKENCDVAIYYSKPSRFYDAEYVEKVFNVYKSVLQSGKRVGIVSDLSINKLKNYKVLIIPNAVYASENTKAKVDEFIKNGGKVIYSGNSLSKDEYKNTLDNSLLLKRGYAYSDASPMADICKYFYDFNMREVELIDEESSLAAIGIDWQYKLGDDGEILVNISNLEYGKTKNISVYYKGEKLSYMTDLISGENGIDTVTVKGFEPRLLSYSPIKTGIENLHVENNKLMWDFVDGRVTKTTVYKVNPNGTMTIAGKTDKNSFIYSGNGCYVVKQDADSGYGKMITVDPKDLYKAKIESVKNSGTGISCKISIENISDIFASGEFFIGIKNAEGEFLDKSIYSLSLKSGEKNEFSLRLPKKELSYVLSVEVCGKSIGEYIIE